MALTFYHVPNSTSNSTSAILAELEYSLGAPLCTRIELSIQAGDTKAPSFVADINPNGRVPVIIHDGLSIWESAAITMYLGEMFGVSAKDKSGSYDNSQLYPVLGPKRGEAMKWIVWTNITIAEAGGRLAAASGASAGEQSPEAEKAMKDLVRWLRVLDSGLKDRKYLLGEEYCLADTHVWSFVLWLTFMKVDVHSFGNVVGWMERTGERPALKKEIEERWLFK